MIWLRLSITIIIANENKKLRLDENLAHRSYHRISKGGVVPPSAEKVGGRGGGPSSGSRGEGGYPSGHKRGDYPPV